MKQKAKILVIDDEEIMREVLRELLRSEGYTAEFAEDGKEGLSMALSRVYDLIITDVMLPELNGIEVLREIKRVNSKLPVIVITAFGSIKNAIEAMKEGAFEYVTKPFDNEELLLLISKALEQSRLQEEVDHLKTLVKKKYSFENIIGKNHEMIEIFKLITRTAQSRSTVLIQGESGTGKELVARAIHQNSPRADKPFVTVNSGSMPADLLESNLFGHERGSFTGAVAAKKGLFEVADRGSIFFDEISNVSTETQVKLLRVIQEKEFMRLGGVDNIKVDVRIIAATNVDLKETMEEGRFREDLFYRLNVIVIPIPPLRSRKDDIPLLAHHFIEKYSRENEVQPPKLSQEAMDCLMQYDFPGNVRELENVIERAVVLNPGGTIGCDLLPEAIRKPGPVRTSSATIPPEGVSFKELVSNFEKDIITQALTMCGGVQKKAAEILHMKPTTLNEIIKRHGIRLKD
jgi:two-component system response regulator PilR (NtrC family)